MAVKRSPFFAPAPLVAVAVLAINDHVLKQRFHNALTGKLTDLALCFFFPLLLSVLLRRMVPHDRRRLAFTGIFTAILFTAQELVPAVGAGLTAAVAVVGHPLGFALTPFTRDLTDLLALVMVPLGCWYGLRRLEGPAASRPPSWLLRAPAMAATLVFLVAEQPPPRCSERSAPLTFRVSGECGRAGLIVVSASHETGHLMVENGEALLGVDWGEYLGNHCPFRLDLGEWDLQSSLCPVPDPDGGAPGGPDGGSPDAQLGACTPQTRRLCQARQEDGGLWLRCSGMGPACRAQLTLVEGP